MKKNKTLNFNRKKIKKIVDELMKETVSTEVFDETCKKNFIRFPKESHKLFKLPGNHYYLNRTEHIKTEGGKKISDIIETILVKEFKRPLRTNIIEFQRENLNTKIEEIPDYYCLAITEFKKLCSITIVTNSPIKKEYENIKIDDDIFNIHFVVFDKKRLYNTINTLNDKYNSNRVVSERDVNLLSYCISSIKKSFAKDYIEKSINFFTTQKMKRKDRLHLFYVIKEMIKYHFKNDLKQKREMLTMIVETADLNEYAGLDFIEAAKLDLKNAQQALNEKDKIITEQNNTLAMKDNTIAKKDNEISKLKSIIESLKKGKT